MSTSEIEPADQPSTIEVLTRGQSLISIFSFAVMIISSGVILGSDSYSWQLAGSFFLFLGMFHIVYATYRIPALYVRLIDYFYVGLGTIGVFFAIQQGAQLREDVLIFIDSEIATVATPDQLHKYVVEKSELICNHEQNKEVADLKKPFCEIADTVDNLLQHNYRAAELDEVIERARNNRQLARGSCEISKGIEGYTTINSDDICKIPSYSRTIINGLKLIRRNLRSNESAVRAQEAEQLSNVIGTWDIFQSVIWPFFLAASLALRLVKVTADVTRWTKD